jgi:hypothetical protein
MVRPFRTVPDAELLYPNCETHPDQQSDREKNPIGRAIVTDCIGPQSTAGRS